MEVRQIGQEDRDEWLKLRTRLWPTESGEPMTSASHVTLDNQHAAVFVAEHEGRLVGFAEVSVRAQAEGCRTSPVGYLEGWYVDAANRSSGVGGTLVKAAEDWASQQGCREMASDCVLGNTVGLVAHEHLGYRPTVKSVFLRKSLS
ncbi:GNAT family N-acetyltransferase [Stratiformator vulcanicus]|uniref:Aminoglycoside N(6')-acetyltransferase type 1 n=1 Tax=Stratiformator vulcanicus TaxID=2527980 RepID=A0A517R4P9_9PLAN|nr:GNAT family N-acetyltransferase [Stratiformator vulcanicus]QDT38855.1 Aminoglycoside N(6')-acetyltransferase type 1 [Stratiformator vulcanicus]